MTAEAACALVTTEAGAVEVADLGPRDGDPVLFLHGGHSGCRERLGTEPLAAAGFRVLVPSRPGYGRTPPGPGGPREAARLMAALLDAVDIEAVHVYGVSAGGPTAIALAAEHPGRVRRLVLASAVTQRWLQPGDRAYRAGRLLFRPGVGRATWAMLHLGARLAPRLLLRGMIGELSTTPPRDPRPSDLAAFRSMILGQAASSGFIADMEQDVPAGLLDRIQAPTLVIHSRNDASVALAHAEHAAARIRGAPLHLVDDEWGHLIWIGPPAAEVTAATAAFLRGEA